jgi:hypothetical protein
MDSLIYRSALEDIGPGPTWCFRGALAREVVRADVSTSTPGDVTSADPSRVVGDGVNARGHELDVGSDVATKVRGGSARDGCATQMRSAVVVML